MKFVTLLLSIIMIISVVIAAKPKKSAKKAAKKAEKKPKAGKKHREEETFDLCYIHTAATCVQPLCKFAGNRCVKA